MGFDAGAVTSTIGIDVSPFAGGMLQATAIARLFPAVVADFMAAPLLGLVDIAEKAADAIKEAFFDVSHSAHELGIQAQQAGVSAEFLEDIGAAAKESGVGTDELARSFAFLTRNAIDARQGNEAAYTSFARLGVSIFDAGGRAKSTQQLFLDVADAIARLKGTGLDTQAAMDLLSRGGIELLPLLHRGSAGIADLADTMRKASGGLSDDLVAISDRAVHLGSVWDSVWEGVHRALATPVLEIVAAHAGDLQSAAIAAGQAMRDGIGAAFAFVEAHAGQVLSGFHSIQATLASTTAFVKEHAAAFIGALAPVGAFLLGSTVPGAIGLLGSAITAVLGAIASPLGIAIAAFAALGAAIGKERLEAGFTEAIAHIRIGVEWISSTAIPVIRTELSEAMSAAAPYAIAFGQEMERAWHGLMEGIAWVRSTAVPVIRTDLSEAWQFIAPAVHSTESAFASAMQVMRDMGQFISGTLVPVVKQEMATAWAALAPIVAATRDAFATLRPVFDDMLTGAKQAFAFLAGAAIQAMNALFGETASTSSQLSTFANLCLVTGHAVGVVLIDALKIATPVLSFLGEVIGTQIRLFADFLKIIYDVASGVGKLIGELASLSKYSNILAAAGSLGVSLLIPTGGGGSADSSSNAAPISAAWNALGAPGSTNSLPSAGAASSKAGNASNALSSSLSPAAVIASNSLQVMNDRVSPVNDLFQQLSDTLGQLNPQFAALVNPSTAGTSATSDSSSSSGSPSGRTYVTFQGGINLPPFNVDDAATQIAAKITPAIREAVQRQQRQLSAAAQSAATKGGL